MSTEDHGDFYDNLNVVMTMLDPADRREMNIIFQACQEHGVPVAEAVRLTSDDPFALPRELYFAMRNADDLGVFERVIALYE